MMQRANTIETQGSEAEANDVILDDGSIAVQGFEVAGLAGLDDFGTIYSWASRVARKIGKAIEKPGKMPLNLAPTAFTVKDRIGVFGKNPLPAGREQLPGMPPKAVGNVPRRGAPTSFAKRMDAFGLGNFEATGSGIQKIVRANVDLAKRIASRVVARQQTPPPATFMKAAHRGIELAKRIAAKQQAGMSVPRRPVGSLGLLARKVATPKKSWGTSILDRVRAKKSQATQRSSLFSQRARQAGLVRSRAQAAANSAAIQQQTTADPNVAQAAEIARRQAEDDARRAEELQRQAEERAKMEAEWAQKAAEIERKATAAAASAEAAEKAAAAAQQAAESIQQRPDRMRRRPSGEDADGSIPPPNAEQEGPWETEEPEEEREFIPEEYAEPEAVAEPERAEQSPSWEDEESEEENAYFQGLGVLLGTDATQAKAVSQTFSRAYVGFIHPGVLLTKQGAAKVGVAGARAAAASKLYTAKADLTQKILTNVAKEGDSLPKGSAARKRKQVQFSVLTRDLIANRAQAERARVIASGATATLRFRKEAQAAMKAGKPAEAKQKLGQAAAAITVTQGFAQTPVRVALPAELSQTTTNELAKEVGMAPPLPEPTKKVKVPSPLPATAAPAARAHYAQQAKVPTMLTPKGRANLPTPRHRPERGLPRPPFSSYVRDPDKRAIEAAVSLRSEGLAGGPYSRVATTFRAGGADGLGSIDGFLDFLKPVADFAKQVVPSHTIVGKLLNGKTGEAAVDAVKLATQKPTPKAPAKPVTIPAANPPAAPSAAEASVAQAVMESFKPQTNMQTGLLIGAGVLSVGLIAMLAFRSRAAPQ